MLACYRCTKIALLLLIVGHVSCAEVGGLKVIYLLLTKIKYYNDIVSLGYRKRDKVDPYGYKVSAID